MRRFKNILVIYDRRVGDEATLARAVALAKANGARLTVAEALHEPPSDTLALLSATLKSELESNRRFLEERQAHLDRLVTSVRHEGVEVEAKVLLGRPFLEIVGQVLREAHDLVIMTADIWDGLQKKITFGSTSMHLMRKCPCPVWVMHPKAGKSFRRILVAIDPLPGEEKPDPLDLKLLQMASSLARDEGCHLDILHAWDFTGADLDTSRSEITEDIGQKLVTRNREAHEKAVTKLLDQVDLAGVDFLVHLPQGEAAREIPRFAVESGVDLIAMGTVGRSGIAGFLIGETAELVLRQVECSVLAVKPDGFVSPISVEGKTVEMELATP